VSVNAWFGFGRVDHLKAQIQRLPAPVYLICSFLGLVLLGLVLLGLVLLALVLLALVLLAPVLLALVSYEKTTPADR
jgi:ABC-type transport system involved in cytochrome bd biosynthesis fused ATPase/permease subunit